MGLIGGMLGSLLLLLDGYLLSSLVCFFAVVVEVIDWFSKGTYRGFYVKFVMVFCVFVWGVGWCVCMV